MRQALLYKYYDSKEALLDAIFEKFRIDHWSLEWAGALSDRSTPLLDRLIAFYLRFIDDKDGISLRLFLRAALDGWPLAANLAELLVEKLVLPLIAELRCDGDLPTLDQLPLLVGEHELVMALHAAILFYCMRDCILGVAMPGDRANVMRLYVSNFLDGVRGSLAGLHRPDAPASLTFPARLPQTA